MPIAFFCFVPRTSPFLIFWSRWFGGCSISHLWRRLIYCLFGLFFSCFDDTWVGGMCRRRVSTSAITPTTRSRAFASGKRPSIPRRTTIPTITTWPFFLPGFYYSRQQHLLLLSCFRNSQHVARGAGVVICWPLWCRQGLGRLFGASTCCHYFAFLSFFLSFWLFYFLLTLAFCLHPAGTTFAPASTNRAAH